MNIENHMPVSLIGHVFVTHGKLTLSEVVMNIQEKEDIINYSLPRIRGYISKPKAGMSQEDINILKLVLLFSDTINNSETKRKEQAINMVCSIVEPTMVVVCKDSGFKRNISISDDQTRADQLNNLFWKLNALRQDLGFTSSKVIELIKTEINKIREPIGLFSIKTSGSNLKKDCNEIIQKVEPHIKDKNEEKLTEILDKIYSSESDVVFHQTGNQEQHKETLQPNMSAG